MQDVRWVFRAPGPGRSEAAIRNTMREGLNQILDRADVSAGMRTRIRIEFNTHSELVTISDISHTQVRAPAPQVAPPVPILGAPQPGEEQTPPAIEGGVRTPPTAAEPSAEETE
jgi:hypothetical protein